MDGDVAEDDVLPCLFLFWMVRLFFVVDVLRCFLLRVVVVAVVMTLVLFSSAVVSAVVALRDSTDSTEFIESMDEVLGFMMSVAMVSQLRSAMLYVTKLSLCARFKYLLARDTMPSRCASVSGFMGSMR